ncbi:HNH endonuclease [Trueperella pyogenes]
MRTATRAFKKARTAFYEEGKAQAASADEAERALAVCWLCLQPIDYEAPPGTLPDSHELDHYYPVSEYPELQDDPANFRHAHRECNNRRGKLSPHLALGTERVADWW